MKKEKTQTIKNHKELSKTQKKWIIVISSVVGTILLAGLAILIVLIISGNEYIGPDGRIRHYYTQTVGDDSVTIGSIISRTTSLRTESAPEGKGYLVFECSAYVEGEYILDINDFKILSTPNIEIDKAKTLEMNTFLEGNEAYVLTDNSECFYVAFLVDEDFWDNDQDGKIILQADVAYFVYDNNAKD